MKCENRTMTKTQSGRMIAFNKEYLDEINFKEGRYEVTYDVDKIIISKIKKVS
jgi:hypothetical protein